MSCHGKFKGHNEAFSHFGISGRLDGLQRSQTHPKCWVNVHEGYCMSMKGILTKVKAKVRSGHERSLWNKNQRHTLRHVFSESFCTQISMVTVIWTYDVMKSDFRWRSGQGQVTFSNQYFYIKTHLSCSESPQDSKNVISFLVRFVELWKIACQKMTHQPFGIPILQIPLSYGALVLLLAIVFWSRVITK